MLTAATIAAMFATLRTACGASGHYVKVGTTGATAITAIKKQSTREDVATGAGLDDASSGRVLVKTADFTNPATRRMYLSTDSGVTYSECGIFSVIKMADIGGGGITEIEYDSINKGAGVNG
jgi:hypothetical protein